MNARQLIAIACTAVIVTATAASAQRAVDSSGANDANTRVGSGGRNSISNKPNPWEVSNSVVYGNVTGGKAFRGGAQSSDPAAFRNTTGNDVQDRFVRDSSGVATNGTSSFNASQTRSYYGDSRAVPPPPGYVGITSTGGYTPPAPAQWRNFDPRQQSVGATASVNPASSAINGSNLPTFTNGPQGLPLSPDLNARQQLNPAALSDYTNLSQNSSTLLSADQLTRLRQEIGQNDVAPPDANAPDNAPAGAVDNALPASTILRTPYDNRIQTSTVNRDALDNSVQAADSQEPGLVTRLAKSSDQSTDTGDASKAPGAQQRPGQAAVDAANDFNAQIRARKAAQDKATQDKADGVKAPAKPGDLQNARPGDANPANRNPADRNPTDTPANMKPDTNMKAGPVTLEAIAGSTRAKGLNDLLTKAEGQMREGKFASAIDTYDQAESVAPKNGLIKLGLVNAELGGSFYRRAEATLRQIEPAEQRVLASQFDLRGFIGDERLQLAQKDLSDLVQKNPNDAGAAVLLAYLYYNTGNDRRATALLDLADKRAQGNDALVTFLKKSWTPATETK